MNSYGELRSCPEVAGLAFLEFRVSEENIAEGRRNDADYGAVSLAIMQQYPGCFAMVEEVVTLGYWAGSQDDLDRAGVASNDGTRQREADALYDEHYQYATFIIDDEFDFFIKAYDAGLDVPPSSFRLRRRLPQDLYGGGYVSPDGTTWATWRG